MKIKNKSQKSSSNNNIKKTVQNNNKQQSKPVVNGNKNDNSVKEKNSSGKMGIIAVGIVTVIIIIAIVILCVKEFNKMGNTTDKTVQSTSSNEETQKYGYDPAKCVTLGDYVGIKESLKVTKSDLKEAINDFLDGCKKNDTDERPEYTDELVKENTDYNTVEEYNKYLKEKLAKENEQQKVEFVWTDYLELCEVKKYPKAIMSASEDEVLQGYYDAAALYGYSKEEIFTTFGYESEQAFIDSDLTDLAQDTAKEYLVAEAIADKEGIEYTSDEYKKMLDEKFEGRSDTDTYKTEEEYEKDFKVYVENQTLLEKVKNFVADKAVFER